MVNKKIISKQFSWEGFDILRFIKGNRKQIIAGVGYILSLFISSDQWINFLSAGAFSVFYTLIEFWFKEIKKK